MSTITVHVPDDFPDKEVKNLVNKIEDMALECVIRFYQDQYIADKASRTYAAAQIKVDATPNSRSTKDGE